MSDTKMLQTILDKVSSVDKRVSTLDKKVDEGFERVNERLDKIGLAAAHLEDDTPTIEEFDNLEKRVGRLEKRQIPA